MSPRIQRVATQNTGTVQKSNLTKKLALQLAEFGNKKGLFVSERPSAQQLRGATRTDATPRGVDGFQEVVNTRNGDLFLMSRGPDMPERWQRLPSEAVNTFFKKELSLNRRSIAKPPVAQPDAHPHFDVTPEGVDGVMNLYLIDGKPFVQQRTPSSPPVWFALEKPRAGTSQGWC